MVCGEEFRILMSPYTRIFGKTRAVFKRGRLGRMQAVGRHPENLLLILGGGVVWTGVPPDVQPGCWGWPAVVRRESAASSVTLQGCTSNLLHHVHPHKRLTLPGGLGISPVSSCLAPATAMLPTAPATLPAPDTAAPTAALTFSGWPCLSRCPGPAALEPPASLQHMQEAHTSQQCGRAAAAAERGTTCSH